MSGSFRKQFNISGEAKYILRYIVQEKKNNLRYTKNVCHKNFRESS